MGQNRRDQILLAGVLAAGAACTTESTPTVDAVGGEGGMKASVEELGRALFFDESLSVNENQSCAACHAEAFGWTGPVETLNAAAGVYHGSVLERSGNRKPPPSAYASSAPPLAIDEEGTVKGGHFLDGRATGWRFGSPDVDQAQGPFLNPLEQALPDAAAVVGRVCSSQTAPLFLSVWGDDACDDVDVAFERVARSIAAFEASPAMSPFSSKFDEFLRGDIELDAQEARGFDLFVGKAKCNNCHVVDPPAGPPVFTDFSYDNLGVPRNLANPFYDMDEQLVDGVPINPDGDDFVDHGLGGFLETLVGDDSWRSEPFVTASFLSLTSGELEELAHASRGMQRVPTLRNVDKRPRTDAVKAYTHNGYFKTLEGLVHFYNTRDVLPRCDGDLSEEQALAEDCWPAPEVPENVNVTELGDLGLDEDEEAAIVAFLATLTDAQTTGQR